MISLSDYTKGVPYFVCQLHGLTIDTLLRSANDMRYDVQRRRLMLVSSYHSQFCCKGSLRQ